MQNQKAEINTQMKQHFLVIIYFTFEHIPAERTGKVRLMCIMVSPYILQKIGNARKCSGCS